MRKNKTDPNQCKNQRDFEKCGARRGWSSRPGKGSHVILHHPDYPGCVSIPGGETSRGVKRQIVRAFLSVGMAALVIGLLYLFYVGG